MAHSRKNQTPLNASIVNTNSKLKVKAARYRALTGTDGVIFFDREGNGATRADNVSVCRTYSQLKSITFATNAPSDTLPPRTMFPNTVLVLPHGPAAASTWADKAVTRLDDLPTHFNKVYGYTGGTVRRPRAETNVTDVRRLHMPRAGGAVGASWFNDSIINGFMSLLWSACPARRALILESQIFASEEKGGSRFEQVRGPKIIKNARIACGMSATSLADVGPQLTRSRDPIISVTLFPFNIGLNHWILLSFDHTVGTWYSYDSYGGHHASVARRFHLHLFRNMGLEPTKFRYVIKDIPRQNDAFQCGVWTCMSALCLVTNKQFPRDTFSVTSAAVFAHAARTYIAKTMITNSRSLTADTDLDLQPVPWPAAVA